MQTDSHNRFKNDYEIFVAAASGFGEFDAYMTRQLNCLTGRYLRFATPGSASHKTSRRGLAHRQLDQGAVEKE